MTAGFAFEDITSQESAIVVQENTPRHKRRQQFLETEVVGESWSAPGDTWELGYHFYED